MRDHNDAKTKFDGYENKDILIDIKKINRQKEI